MTMTSGGSAPLDEPAAAPVDDDTPVAGAGAASVLSPALRATTIGAVALVTLVAFESMAVATAMPTVAEALDGVSRYAVAFGATLATALVGMAAAGPWSDRAGPARPIAVGVTTFVAGLVVAGLAPTMSVLVLGRAVQGLGSGVVTVALYVLVGHVYAEELRPKVFAALAAAWVVPAVVGPLLAGLVVTHLGWRWVFLLVALLVVPAALAVRPGLRLAASHPAGAPAGPDAEPQAAREAGRSVVGWAVLAALGAGVLHIAGHELTPLGAVAIGVGVVAVGVAARRLLPAGTGRAARGLPAVFALRGVAAAAFFGGEVFLPLLLDRERGLSAAAAGSILTVGALSWSAASWYQGGPGQRLTAVRRLRIGYTAIAAGIAVVALLVVPAVPVVVGVAGWSVAGFGMGLLFPTLSVLMLGLSPVAEQGANSSSLQLADALATTVTLALSGALFAVLEPRSAVLAYTAGLAVAGTLAALGAAVSGRVEAPDVAPAATGALH
ncbi:MAG: MFS transporter [Actinomycetota bacterium]|nr:MFS transporter [Actinomycetota bacterium]